jgi:hypothetical protein
MQNPNNDIGIIKTKICSKCKEPKELKHYVKDKYSKDGISYKCKECNKKYKNDNKESIKKCWKIYYQTNKEEIKRKSKEYINTRIPERTEYNRKRFQEKKEQIYEYNRKHRNIPTNKLKEALRISLLNILRRNKINKNNKSAKYLGCTLEEYKQHIEQQFKPEMNWVNWGEVWELDHMKPLSKFDMSIEENIFKAFHYTNMQPLFKTTEIAKSFGYEDEIGNRNKYNKII